MEWFTFISFLLSIIIGIFLYNIRKKYTSTNDIPWYGYAIAWFGILAFEEVAKISKIKLAQFDEIKRGN